MPSSRLRIAGGSARGTPIAEPRGLRLRPTSGLVREAIFNILSSDIEDANVLDLYAGTGALGVEGLSRGARSATFVDAEAASCQAILQTLARTNFSGQGTVVRGRLPGAAETLTGTFDIILMDPPYNDPSADETLRLVPRLLTPEGRIVFEHSSRYNPPERPVGLQLLERRVYGDSAIALYACVEGE